MKAVPIEEIHPGDVVSINFDEKHWHGAGPTTAMTHVPVGEALEMGRRASIEKVSNEDYKK